MLLVDDGRFEVNPFSWATFLFAVTATLVFGSPGIVGDELALSTEDENELAPYFLYPYISDLCFHEVNLDGLANTTFPINVEGGQGGDDFINTVSVHGFGYLVFKKLYPIIITFFRPFVK